MNYPPLLSDEHTDDSRYLSKDEEHVHHGDSIEITFRHTETGTTCSIPVTIISSLSHWQASSDWKKDDANYTTLDNKVAIWTERSNIQYVGTGESAVFSNLIPGRGYEFKYGYLLDDGRYITGSFFVKTVQVKLQLTLIGTLEVFATMSCNYEYDLEYWSDQNPEHQIVENTTGADITQAIQSLHYMTIYAQVKDMPDTRTEIPKIFIPYKYDGMLVNLSGTTAILQPNLIGMVDNVGYTISIDGRSFYRKYGTPVTVNELEPGTIYPISITITYEDPYDSALNHSETLSEYIRTYGVKLVATKTTNTARVNVAQTIGAYGPDQNNLIVLDKKQYKVSMICIIDDEEETDVFIGKVDEYPFSNLLYDTSYRFNIELLECNDFSNNPDATASIEFRTLKAVETGMFTASVSGQSVTITPIIRDWNESSSLTITTTITKDGEQDPVQTLTQTINNGNIAEINITNLEYGCGYGISFYGTDNFGNNIPIEPLHIKTYGLVVSVSVDDIHSTYMSYSTEYVDGQDADGHSQYDRSNEIYGYLTLHDESLPIMYLSTASGMTQKVLIPNTEYDLHMFIRSISDLHVISTFRTKTPAHAVRYDETHTGTTITLNTVYESDDIKNYILTTECELTDLDGDFHSQYEFTDNITITGLIQGHKYKLSFHATDTDGNGSNNYIILDDISKEILLFDLWFEDIQTTSRCVKFRVVTNQTLPVGKKLFVTVDQNERLTDMLLDGPGIAEVHDLVQSAKVDLRAHITNMANEHAENDALVEDTTKTKQLTVEIVDILKTRPDKITVEWVGLCNGEKTIVDPICNEPYDVDIDNCYTYDPETKTKSYQASIGNRPNTVVFINAAAYFRCGMSVTITDGYNKATCPITYSMTEDPTVMISLDNVWHKAVVYISKNNEFHKAIPYISKNNSWQMT